jgi:hypothetical protein
VNVSVRLVASPTATNANGEFATLAPELTFIDEWDDDVVAELTGDTLLDETTAIDAFSVDIPFDPALYEAVSIEFGPSFTEDQQAVTDNVNGRITGLSAGTSRTDAGRDNFVVLARVIFRVKSDVNLLNNLVGTYILPSSTDNFATEQLVTDIVGGADVLSGLIGPTTSNVWPVMYDQNDNGVIGFDDVASFAQSFGRNVNVEESAFSSDFDRSGVVGFGDVALLAQNFGRSRSSTGQQSYAGNFPTAWTPQALVVGDARSVAAPLPAQQPPLTQTVLRDLQAAAIDRLEDVGVAASELDALRSVEIRVQDLPDGYLGLATDDAIIVDINASGTGWFIDDTPLDDHEYGRQAQSGANAAQNRFDLLTVIAHELGHHIGWEHAEDGVMSSRLNPGERRLPQPADIDSQFAALVELDEVFGLE